MNTLIDLLEMRFYDQTKFGELCVSAISVEQWSTKFPLQSLDRIVREGCDTPQSLAARVKFRSSQSAKSSGLGSSA